MPMGFPRGEEKAFTLAQQAALRTREGRRSKSVENAMHREKAGTLRSGKGGRGGKVTNPKQAIAIGLSEARKKGAKVPSKSATKH